MNPKYTAFIDGKIALNVYIYDASPTPAPAQTQGSAPPIPAPEEWFDLQVQTSAPGQTYSFEIAAGTGIDLQADWGDGSALDSFVSTGRKSHAYANPGTYTLRIKGRLGANGWLKFGQHPDSLGLKQILSAMPDFGLTSAESMFQDCGNLIGPIPGELFQSNLEITTFRSVFADCPQLDGTIPADLFRINTQAETFRSAFSVCTSITGPIPEELFRYNTLATDFSYVFSDCYELSGAIPKDLFKYNTQAVEFAGTFFGCVKLTGSIPAGLFEFNTQAVNFIEVFFECLRLQVTASIFYQAANKTTRFAGKDMDFTNAFQSTGILNTGNVAPDLWACTFGSVVNTDCFMGATSTLYTNFASIPLAWR